MKWWNSLCKTFNSTYINKTNQQTDRHIDGEREKLKYRGQVWPSKRPVDPCVCVCVCVCVNRGADGRESEVEMIHSAVYAIFKALSLGPINGAFRCCFLPLAHVKKLPLTWIAFTSLQTGWISSFCSFFGEAENDFRCY